MIIYRGVVKPDEFKTRHMMQPSFKLEARRDSKRLEAEARKKFAGLLAQHPPVGRAAEAWLERSDRFGSHTLARGGISAGRWVLV